MPELAEVEFYRKRWHQAAIGESVVGVLTHDRKRLLRELDLCEFRRVLTGATLVNSEARAKQMLFRFSGAAGEAWLGIHLGMSGELTVEPPTHAPGKHDHLVIVTNEAGLGEPRQSGSATPATRNVPAALPSSSRSQRLTGDGSPYPGAGHALVFSDPRMFGRIEFHVGKEPPLWWKKIAPSISSRHFTPSAVADFLRRRRRAPIKAVLLMQERFPGVGNWMADEILWRAAMHPARLAGSLTPAEIRALWRECRRVCRLALDTIAGRGRRMPPDLNANIPDSWLFNHRWQRGGKDPITGTSLAHATIGGRTTCWSPARQKLIGSSRKKA